MVYATPMKCFPGGIGHITETTGCLVVSYLAGCVSSY